MLIVIFKSITEAFGSKSTTHKTMDKNNKIERLKDSLHDTDYKAIKHSEGWLTDEEYAETKAERQAIRNEINTIQGMTDEEYYEAYPEEESEGEE